MTTSVLAGDQNPAPNAADPANPTPTSVVQQQPPAQSQDDALGALVGEGKKFATVEDLAKGKAESDAFIEQLKAENAGIRKALEDLSAKVSDSSELESKLDSIAQQAESMATPLDPSVIREEVTKTVQSIDEQKTHAANIKALDEAVLSYVDGDVAKAAAYAAEKAAELGVSVDYIINQAKVSPKAALNMLGLNVPKKKVDSIQDAGGQPSHSSPQSAPSGTLSTMDDFNALRKSDPRKFYSPAVQNQLFQLRKKGEL